jgi:DNA-binding HxlR family transcriptional regulator
MAKYGQFCPVARALEILGDRWTLLIVRDLIIGTRHFNDLERGLPRISRSILAARLRHLQKVGIIEKQQYSTGRQTTEYQLTEAGEALTKIIGSLWEWGEAWAFHDPTPEELDPVLLMWWLRGRVNVEQLPGQRIVIQFDFYGADKGSCWLVLTIDDVTICLTDPGYEISILVTADLATCFKLQAGRITYQQAISQDVVRVEGVPGLTRAFPHWFGWVALSHGH